MRRARALIRPRVPEGHGLIARTDIRLAEILAARWRDALESALQTEADSLFRAGLALGMAIPEVRRSRFFITSSFARELHAWGRWDDAELMMREALDAGAETLGPDHPVSLTARSELGRMLAQRGRLDEALATTEDALARLSEAVPPDAMPRVNAAANRARVLLAAGRADEARALLTRVEVALDEDHPLRGAIEELLAETGGVGPG